MNDNGSVKSFKVFRTAALAVDPIHVGAGGAGLGRVDNTIVRDPVTRAPKIPGSSLAGVHRAYAAMAYEETHDSSKRRTPYYPNCAGQGKTDRKEHCGEDNCEVCTVFGRVSFAGLAGFSDAQLLLFPVATREGPVWITCPDALRNAGIDDTVNDNCVHRRMAGMPLNLGWIMLESKLWSNEVPEHALKKMQVPDYVCEKRALVSNKLFSHIVNSNLEVHTSVAIDPRTGAAEDRALFTYEALPRGAVLLWDVTCRNPKHFASRSEALKTVDEVHGVVAKAHPFLEALGIGGMGTRGMGRLRILSADGDGLSTPDVVPIGNDNGGS